jgi:perosamine synthetase
VNRIKQSAHEGLLHNVVGTFMGRDALSLAASWLEIGANDTVLLPAFVCDEVIKPFANVARVAFYDIGRDLAIHPATIAAMLSERSIKVMVVVNYFGFLQPHRDDIRRICENKGVVLIEDCAHSLLTEGSGTIGDLSIYSYRKILPVSDGGGLRINMVGRTATPRFYPRLYSNVLSTAVLLKSLLKVRTDAWSRSGLTSQAGKLSTRSAGPPTAAGNGRILPMSVFARHGIRTTSLSDVIEKRRADYEFWHDLSNRTGVFSPVFECLPAGVCPLGFPAFMNDRERVRSLALAKGIYLKVHWRLPSVIGVEYPISRELAETTVTLPVYPELSPRDRDVIRGILAAQ